MAHVETRRGTVKWFDFAKHYGFVTLDGGDDAMLHASRLKAHNIRDLPKGTTGEFVVEDGPKGLCVKGVVSLQQPEAYMNGGNYTRARVKWFDHGRGYGFLTAGEGTPDIFIHATTVKASALVELRQDQEVMVVTEPSDRGPKVVHIRGV